MKKKFDFGKHLCSSFDERPIYEPEDNLYAGAEYESNVYDAKLLKNFKIKRNIDKNEENYYFNGEN